MESYYGRHKVYGRIYPSPTKKFMKEILSVKAKDTSNTSGKQAAACAKIMVQNFGAFRQGIY